MQCTAHSSRTGKPCQGQAIKGGNVCRYHGGAAPQVKRSAALRLAALVDPSIGVLAELLKSRKALSKDRLNAALGVLDRTGYGPGQLVTVDTTGNAGEALKAVDVIASAIAGLAAAVPTAGSTEQTD